MQVVSFSPFGYEGSLVNVEVDLRRGIPAIDIVGLSDSTVKEARERMRAAIANSGLEFPSERVLISLSPADLKKEGAGFDLALAMAVLSESEKKQYPNEKVLVMGELELSGKLRPVRGSNAAIQTAHENGITHFIVPDGIDYQFPENSKVLKVKNLQEAASLSKNLENFVSINNVEKQKQEEIEFPEVDAEELIDGEFLNKNSDIVKSIEVSIAGKHNILLTGAPGCGKTLLTQKLIPQLTPLLTDKEAETVSRIRSLAGFDIYEKGENLKKSYIPPFRMPHQTASIEGMVGGGSSCRPGEVTLAHNGTLFLDEAAEFRSSVLQCLRVPLETKSITLSRAGRSTVFPADFQMVMVVEPSPDGAYLSDDRICLSSKKTIELYWKKFSEPLLDRIEIKNFMDKENNKNNYDVSFEKMKERIATAYKIQRERGVFNSHLTQEQISQYCKLDEKSNNYYEKIVSESGFNHREVFNLLKISLTIANLDGREQIKLQDLQEGILISSNDKMRELLNLVFNKDLKRIEPEKKISKSKSEIGRGV